MAGRAKIKSTLNGGYAVPDDMDIDHLKQLQRRRRRQEQDDNVEQGLAADTIRKTYAVPYTLVCLNCERAIQKGTKFNMQFSTAPELFLGKLKVNQMAFRCPRPGCGNKIRMVVNPETLTYDIVEGGKANEIQKLAFSASVGGKPFSEGGGEPLTEEQKQQQAVQKATSFEDVKAMLFAESEAIDMLGDSYVPESEQVTSIRDNYIRQMKQRQREEREKAQEEKALLEAEFAKAKQEFSFKIGGGVGDESSSSGRNNNNHHQGALVAAKQTYKNGLAEAKALFVALERAAGATNAVAAPVPSAPQQQQQQRPAKKGLMDFLSDSD